MYQNLQNLVVKQKKKTGVHSVWMTLGVQNFPFLSLWLLTVSHLVYFFYFPCFVVAVNYSLMFICVCFYPRNNPTNQAQIAWRHPVNTISGSNRFFKNFIAFLMQLLQQFFSKWLMMNNQFRYQNSWAWRLWISYFVIATQFYIFF